MSAENTPFTAYARMDALLSLQHPQTGSDTEPGFIILSQVKELLFHLLVTEFGTARDYIAADRIGDALWTLRRSARVQQLLISCWDSFDALAPGDFASFRGVLGSASGLQSFSYRRLEFLLGNKNPAMVRPHVGTPQHAWVLDQLRQPSLYDEVIRYLARRGLDIPPGVTTRDFSVPYEPCPEVTDAWRSVYARPGRDHDLFLLAEALMDAASLFARWRYTHLVTVQRMLGDKPGTGGTDGAHWLSAIANHRFFPELWIVRTNLDPIADDKAHDD
jgi:tryptophan 2,3-dioxygenase